MARAFWLVVVPPQAPALTPLPLQPNLAQQAIAPTALDIFAQPVASQPQAAPPPDIKILGVTVASPARFSYAIINANGKTQSYRVHDTIEGSSYTLTEVGRDYIMISDGSAQPTKIQFGQPFSLDQSEAIRAKAAALANPQAGMPATMNNTMPATSAPATAALSMPEVSQPNATQDSGAKAAIGSAINGLQQDPAGYLSQMGMAATGQGYLVTDGMPAPLKSRLGLQTGDKVLSVNGQSIGQNPNQDVQLLQQVQRAGQAQIQVQRGDQVVTVRQSF